MLNLLRRTPLRPLHLQQELNLESCVCVSYESDFFFKVIFYLVLLYNLKKGEGQLAAACGLLAVAR